VESVKNENSRKHKNQLGEGMNKKITIGVVTLLLIIIAALGAYSSYYERAIYPNLPKLTDAERQLIDERLLKTNKALETPELTDKEKFNLTMQVGFNEYVLGNYREAESAYKTASEIKTDNNYVSYVALYQLYLDIQKNRSARAMIQKALSLSPTSADIWNKYIVLEKERFNANSETLDKLYKEAIETTFYNVDVLSAYATLLAGEGRYAEAIEYWTKAITYNPSAKDLYEQEISALKEKTL